MPAKGKNWESKRKVPTMNHLLAVALAAFLTDPVATVSLQKVVLPMKYRAAIMLIMIGTYPTLSGLSLNLFSLEHGYSLEANLNLMPSVLVTNGLICILLLWPGLLAGKQR